MPTPTNPPNCNATIAISRRTYSAVTKQSTFAPVGALAAVPVFLANLSHDMIVAGVAPEFTMKLCTDTAWDIHNGDQFTGYNPTNMVQEPVYVIEHVASMLSPGMRGPQGIRTALVKVLGQ